MHIRDRYNALYLQHQRLLSDHRDLKTEYARLSTQVLLAGRSMRNVSVLQHGANQDTQAYTMITPTIAIGSLNSDYDPFDIVVDLSFQGPNARTHHHDVVTITRGTKQITRVAIYDNPSEKDFMKLTLSSMIPSLIQYYSRNPSLKILFHCYAGISRSASLCIALLAKLESCSYDIALGHVKEMRPEVEPNTGFVEAIEEYLAAAVVSV